MNFQVGHRVWLDLLKGEPYNLCTGTVRHIIPVGRHHLIDIELDFCKLKWTAIAGTANQVKLLRNQPPHLQEPDDA